jgi:hypothetical protein
MFPAALRSFVLATSPRRHYVITAFGGELIGGRTCIQYLGGVRDLCLTLSIRTKPTPQSQCLVWVGRTHGVGHITCVRILL